MAGAVAVALRARILGSLRARVFLMVVLVAAAATGAAAWLTLRDAAVQLTESATVRSETIATIHDELLRYGRTHGTWEGVPRVVEDLRRRTGQRIRLTTASDGAVIVDTDHLAGRTSRPHPAEPITRIDPTPELDLSGVADALLPVVTLESIDVQRHSVRTAACLSRRGVPVTWAKARGGLGLPAPSSSSPEVDAAFAECRIWGAEDGGLTATDRKVVTDCMPPTTVATVAPQVTAGPVVGGADDVRACFAEAFGARTALVGPVPLLLYLGAVGGAPAQVPDLSAGRALVAAALVALLAVVVTVLLTQRVLGPIAALIRASRRLGEGDLTERVPVRGNDELAELAVTFNRMADSLQRSKQQQRRMVGDIAHELRTPLANLRGYLEALKDGVVEPNPELFASLHEEAVLQQRLVDDLHELALAEAGALVSHRTLVDLVELLETCRTAHLPAAEAAGIALVVEAGELPTVLADPDRLRQAIGNLVTNALRATPPGGTVALRGAAGDGGARITVEDTGHGIAPEDLPRVFDRLWRADGSRHRGTGGSGLGLAITREIVTAHRGTITAESVLGERTTFVITLPAATRAADANHAGPAPA